MTFPHGGGGVNPPPRNGAGGGNPPHGGHDAAEPRFHFTDRRRIDPRTGSARDVPQPGSAAADPGNPANAEQPIRAAGAAEALAAAQQEAAERTADLQRITAEYANYRKRSDRDKGLALTAGKAAVIADLLPVLDDVDRARSHGDLTGALRAVADRLSAVLEKEGLAAFGAPGDAFDPAVHEAVQFDTSAEVSAPTVTAVYRPGYTFAERTLRPAVVVVTGPAHDESAPAEPATSPEPPEPVSGTDAAEPSTS